MYKINGIDLSTFGFVPTKQNGSDLALSGFMDMPSRVGKCYHLWPSKAGVEPYTSAGEIFFGGRNINLLGHIVENSREECSVKLNSLYNFLNTLKDIVSLETPYGNFSVIFKDPIDGSYIGNGVMKVFIVMFEPVPDLTGVIPSSTQDSSFGFDGVPFSAFGSVIIGVYGDRYNRSAPNLISLTGYPTKTASAGYPGLSKITVKLFVKANSYGLLRSRIASFYKLLASSGERNLIISEDLQRRVFACDGFSVTDIRNNDDWYCFIDIPLVQSQPPQIVTYLADNLGNLITDNLNNKVLIKYGS